MNKEVILTEEEAAAMFEDTSNNVPQQNQRDLSFLGDVAQIVPQLTAQFNKGYQQNQLAIAQANANAAASAAQTEQLRATRNPNRALFVVGGIVVGVIVLVIILKR